jgi:hypothetical protein
VKKKFGKSFETTEGFCFVISAIGLDRPDSRMSGVGDDDDDDLC